MDKHKPFSPRAVVEQAFVSNTSGLGCGSAVLVSGKGDVLLLHDHSEEFDYRTVYDLFEAVWYCCSYLAPL